MFSTDRLVLRPYTEPDLDELCALWNEVGVQTGAAIDYVIPRGLKWRETYRSWLEGARLHWIIESRETHEFIGYLTLRDENPKNRDGDLAITLKTAHWGKGYASEVLKFTVDYAFRVLNLHRVSLGVFETNERAVNLYKKVGFTEEGRIRKANWIDGAWTNIILMGILDEEWAARQSQQ